MRLYEPILIVHHHTEVGSWRRQAKGYLHRFFLNQLLGKLFARTCLELSRVHEDGRTIPDPGICRKREVP